MKNLIVLFMTFYIVSSAFGQDNVILKLKEEASRSVKKEADTTTWNWKKGGLLGFSLAQGSLTNWAAGGDNFTMSLNTSFNYFFLYKKDRISWDNNVEAYVGILQSTSLGTRKNDDRFDFLSKYGYKMDTLGKWYLSALFNFRSQFFDGATYKNGTEEFTSSFLSPAYLTLSLGFDYKPSGKFSVFLSPLTGRSTFVTNNQLAAKGGYGIPPGDHGILQIGAFSTINYYSAITKNILYKGRLDLFSNYQSHPENIDINSTNVFSFKISKNFSASYTLDMIYDDDIRLFGEKNTSPALQIKSLIGIGFVKTINEKKTRIADTK
jgi:hypothetical protein